MHADDALTGTVRTYSYQFCPADRISSADAAGQNSRAASAEPNQPPQPNSASTSSSYQSKVRSTAFFHTRM